VPVYRIAPKCPLIGHLKSKRCHYTLKPWFRQVDDRFITEGNTVNLCIIDLSKAFDKVNYQALLIKLIKRKFPVALLNLLENWLKILSQVLYGVIYFHILLP